MSILSCHFVKNNEQTLTYFQRAYAVYDTPSFFGIFISCAPGSTSSPQYQVCGFIFFRTCQVHSMRVGAGLGSDLV
jgi:hypothetical protein